jgi:hypothetical protein
MTCKSSRVHSLLSAYFLLEITKKKLYYLNHPKGIMIKFTAQAIQNIQTKTGKKHLINE